MSTLDDQEVLRHGAFLRRLARHLLKDVDAAEDIVQQAMAQALERPPKRSQRLRAWLGATTRNLAMRHLRDQARHRSIMDSVNRRAQLEGKCDSQEPLGLLEHRETLRKVTVAVSELDDRSFQAILLRYYENLPPAEIAAKLGIPIPTLSSRLQRALVKLRDQLDRDQDTKWRGHLAAFAAIPLARESAELATKTTVLFWSGAVQVKAWSFGVASIAVLASIVFLAIESSREGNDIEPAGAGGFAASTSSSARRAALDSAPNQDPAEDEVPSVKSQVQTTDAGPGDLELSIRWTDDDSPAPKVRALLFLKSALSVGRPLQVAQSNSTGHAWFRGLDPSDYVVRVGGESHEVQVEPDACAELVVPVQSTTDVRGIVTTSGGAPIEGAWIVTHGQGTVAMVTDSNGEFRVRSTNQIYRIGARAHGFAASPIHALTSSQEPIHIRLTESGGMIDGCVIDAEGEPVAHEEVVIGKDEYSEEPLTLPNGSVAYQIDLLSVKTDAQGRFSALGLSPGEVSVRVPAFSPKYAEWCDVVDVQQGQAKVLLIQLQRTVAVFGVVRDSSGSAVDGAQVEASFGGVSRRTSSAGDGSYRISGIAPGPVTLSASDQELGEAHAEADIGSAWDFEWSPTLRHEGSIGQVVDHEGRPCVGVVVRASAPGFEARTRSRSDGRFTLRGCPERVEKIQVIAQNGPWVLGAWSGVVVPKAGLLLQLDRSASRPCRIRARLLGPDGQAAADARLHFGFEGEKPIFMSGAADQLGEIEIGGIRGSAFEVFVRSTTYGPLACGLHSPDAEGLVDLGTIHLESPGQFSLLLDPEALRSRVKRFSMTQVLDAGHRYEVSVGAGLPPDSLRLPPGRYELRLEGDEIETATSGFKVTALNRCLVDIELIQARN